MPLWLLYLLLCVATLSGTWLIIEDKFPPIAAPRKAIVRWLDQPRIPDKPVPWPLQAVQAVGRSFAYLLTCGFCMGFWVALVVVFWTAEYTSVPLPWLAVATARIFTGLAMSAYLRAEERWELTRRQRVLANEEMRKVGFQYPEED